ncbi:MAG: replication and repair protein RadC [Acidobacteria bacterium]|nr:replication and repair protein RadC [Acidobacteriota bacterium]
MDETPVICPSPAMEQAGDAQAVEEDTLALLSTILGQGRRTAAAQVCSRRLMRQFGTASALTLASQEELRLGGKVSSRQAAVLRAALTLGRRLCAEPLRPGQRFASSRDLFLRYRAQFFAATREYFVSLHLNSKNQLIREVLVSVGSLSTSVVHPREVFSAAVRDSSAALIFLHNHPSGDPAPSREDRECTQRLCRAGKILGIRVLDHVILGYDDYFSFADAGQLIEAADCP